MPTTSDEHDTYAKLTEAKPKGWSVWDQIDELQTVLNNNLAEFDMPATGAKLAVKKDKNHRILQDGAKLNEGEVENVQPCG